MNGLFIFDRMSAEKDGDDMTKVIYLDIDGTLRDEKKGVPESSRYAVKRCREKGIYIVICTGRSEGTIQEDVKVLETDGVISGGGSRIRIRGEELQKKNFPEDITESVLRKLKKTDLGIALESEKNVYMNKKAADFYQDDFERKFFDISKEEAEREKKKNKIDYVDNLQDLKETQENIHKYCLIGGWDELRKIEKELYGAAEVVQKKRWNGQEYMEFLPAGCTKGSAVERVNDWLGISREDSMAFGDSENDLEMFRAVGTAVFVGNGSSSLAAQADSVCEKPDEDGIYRELVRRNIIEEN